MSIPPFGSAPTPDATASKKGKVQLTGDLGGTAASPQVVSTHLSAALPVSQGGSGATTLTGLVKGNGTSAFTAVTAPTGAVVGDTDSQTLSSKTLTTPIVNGLNFAYVSKNTNYTATATDEFIAGDATSASFTITLPTAVGVSGRRYTIKKTDSSVNTVTVGTTSSQTIDGATTYVLSAQYQTVTVISNGANWLVEAIQVAGAASFVVNEVPGGSVNSANTTFTTAAQFQSGSLEVHRNGIRLKNGGVDFTENSTLNGFTMTSAPQTGDILLVDYKQYNSTLVIGSNSTITNETPTGSVNSSNTSFTTARAYIAGTLEVWIDGIYQKRATDYTETTPSSGTFTMTTAPVTGQTILVAYQYNLNPSSNADTVDGVHASTVGTAESGQLIADYGGWVSLAGTFTFNSSTAMNTPSDFSGLISVGDKIRYKQGAGYLYGVVTAISSTVLTLTGGSDYSVANSAITNVFYSKQASPYGFPQWFNYSPTLSGWSANPGSAVYRFTVIGRMCKLEIGQNSGGTSNASSTTITLPITAATVTNYAKAGACRMFDNGVNLTNPAFYVINSGATTIGFWKDFAQTALTASGTKQVVWCSTEYEI